MASRRSYTCFVCQKAGHEVQVFLDGKDEQGHTKYLNEDMTKHTHLGSISSTQQQNQQRNKKSATTVTYATKEDLIMDSLRDLNIKMNRVIEMLDVQGQK